METVDTEELSSIPIDCSSFFFRSQNLVYICTKRSAVWWPEPHQVTHKSYWIEAPMTRSDDIDRPSIAAVAVQVPATTEPVEPVAAKIMDRVWMARGNERRQCTSHANICRHRCCVCQANALVCWPKRRRHWRKLAIERNWTNAISWWNLSAILPPFRRIKYIPNVRTNQALVWIVELNFFEFKFFV